MTDPALKALPGAPWPLAYVGARLSAADLVQQVQATLRAQGRAIAYDWTTHGSVRGDPERLRQVGEVELQAAFGADWAVYLLINGLDSPQRGVHAELGASLCGGGQVMLWAPPEHEAILADATGPRMLAFYLHPRVARVVCPEEHLLAAVAHWARGNLAPGHLWRYGDRALRAAGPDTLVATLPHPDADITDIDTLRAPPREVP